MKAKHPVTILSLMTLLMLGSSAFAECLPGKTTVKYPMNLGKPDPLSKPKSLVTVSLAKDCKITSVKGVQRADNVWRTNEFSPPINCWQYPFIRVINTSQFCLENSLKQCIFDNNSPFGNVYLDNIGSCEYEVSYAPIKGQPVPEKKPDELRPKGPIVEEWNPSKPSDSANPAREKTPLQIKIENAYMFTYIIPAKENPSARLMDFFWIMDDSASMAELQKKINGPLNNQITNILEQRAATSKDWVVTTRGRLLLSSLQGNSTDKKKKILSAILETQAINGPQTEKTFPQMMNFLSKRSDTNPITFVLISDENEQSNKTISEVGMALLKASEKTPVRVIFIVNSNEKQPAGKDVTMYSQRYRELYGYINQNKKDNHMINLMLVNLPKSSTASDTTSFEDLFTKAFQNRPASTSNPIPFKSEHISKILMLTVNGNPLSETELNKTRKQTSLILSEGQAASGDVVEIFFEK